MRRLLGREREMAKIDRLLADARVGASGCLVVRGEAGIGKTALLDHAQANARGMQVLTSRGVQFEADVAFAGLHALLRPAFGTLQRLPANHAAVLRAALALGERGEVDRLLIGAATLSLLCAHADDAAVLVLVDDAHWLDRSSAEALAFAARRLLADPVAVLIALREEQGSPLLEAGLPELQLAGLDQAAGVALLQSAARAPLTSELADRVFRTTAGNPLALRELAGQREQLEDVPNSVPLPVTTTLEREFLRRADDVSESARLALVVAAAAEPAEIDTIRRAALRCGVGLDAVEEAELAWGLVARRGGLIEFRHPLARAAVYNAARPSQRRAAHRALADVLIGPKHEDHRAWHLAEAAAGPDEDASEALDAAGRRARERGAFASAASAFERSGRLTQVPELQATRLLQAAEAAWLAGRVDRAADLLQDGRPDLLPTARWLDLERLQGRIALRRGHIAEGYQLLRRVAEVQAEADAGGAALTLGEAALGSHYAGRPEEFMAASEQAMRLAGDAAGPASFVARAAFGAAAVLAGRGAEGVAVLRRALQVFPGWEAAGEEPLVLVWAAIAALFLREAESGRDLIERAVDEARTRAPAAALPQILHFLGRDAATTDRWPLARAQYEEAIRLARETGETVVVGAGLAGLAWLDAREGREEACALHASESIELTTRLGLGFYRSWTFLALADLELGRGAVDAAREHLLACRTLLDELQIGDADLDPAPEIVDAYMRLGRSEEARTAAAGYVLLAADKGQPWSLARAFRCRGMIADETGFESAFDAALDHHARTPDTFERARTELYYGERLRRARRRTIARDHLRSALATFERLGAGPWAERARVELRATGETARTRDDSSRDLLTPQELQIALALGAGRTTRETAAKLFLSPKTVEYHLRNVYGKLRVRSREQLQDELVRLHLA